MVRCYLYNVARQSVVAYIHLSAAVESKHLPCSPSLPQVLNQRRNKGMIIIEPSVRSCRTKAGQPRWWIVFNCYRITSDDLFYSVNYIFRDNDWHMILTPSTFIFAYSFSWCYRPLTFTVIISTISLIIILVFIIISSSSSSCVRVCVYAYFYRAMH